MALDLTHTLVIGISASALFDLREADAVFQSQGIRAYREHMLALEGAPLATGTGFALVAALLSLNVHGPKGAPALVEVVIMSRNSPETGVRVMRAVRERGLAISRYVFTGGEPLSAYARAFGVDLFLSNSVGDVQTVVDSAVCAAAVLSPPPEGYQPAEHQVRFAFDGDAVLFSEDAEIVYKSGGLGAFHASEDEARDVPLPEGPFARFLVKLARLKETLPQGVEYSPIRIAVVTARNAPAEARVITTFRAWGVYVDEAFFLGGLAKDQVLAAFRPHIFFDDQDVHVSRASGLVPSGRVPYKTGSVLRGGSGEEREKEGSGAVKAGVVHLTRSPADGG